MAICLRRGFGSAPAHGRFGGSPEPETGENRKGANFGDYSVLRALARGGAGLIRSAGLEYFGAGGAFRVLEIPVLRNDERPAQRDHH